MGVGGGSKVRVAFTPIPFAFENKKVGLSLRMEAVQVIELAQYVPSSPFDSVEGGFTADEPTPFDGDDKPGDDKPGDDTPALGEEDF